jgi:tetratricopeptide (TPR) repeat protein
MAKKRQRNASGNASGAKPSEPKQQPARPARAPLSRGKAAAFLAITLAFPFILLIAIEIALRIGHYGGDTSAFDTPPGWKGRYKVPGENVGRRYFPRERFPPAPPADVFLAKKPAHSMRIFVLGESSAAGFPFPRNGAFARVLRDALSDVLPSDTVEVINMGMAATNSYTIADLAGDIVREQPDAIVIYGGHNEYYGALGAGSTETLGSHPSFVRMYLRLQRFKTVLLLRNTVTSVLSRVRGDRSTQEIEADATRMESVVADQNIVLGDETYQIGADQYESNLRAAIGTFKSAGIPVFIGSPASNLRDLRPFGTSAVPPDSGATIVFDSARARLAARDSVNAAVMFTRARDLDVIRFRAPSDFQSIVQRVAKETGSTYVPVAEGVAAASAFRIPGNDLFLEHVHPNQRGYVLLARMYFDALQKKGFLGRRADMSRFAGWDAYMARMTLTDFDQRMAMHTVRTLTTRWPFVPVSQQQDYRGTYKPTDFIDSISLFTSRGGMPWAQAKMAVGERYAAAGDIERALAEFQGLLRDGPEVEIGWRLIGKTLYAANQTERAKPYLERAYQLRPTPLTAFTLGVIAMQEKNRPRAIALLQQALELSPDMPGALYHLSLAYALERNLDRARTLALRLAQVAPNYPGLGGWMTTLGMVPR